MDEKGKKKRNVKSFRIFDDVQETNIFKKLSGIDLKAIKRDGKETICESCSGKIGVIEKAQRITREWEAIGNVVRIVDERPTKVIVKEVYHSFVTMI